VEENHQTKGLSVSYLLLLSFFRVVVIGEEGGVVKRRDFSEKVEKGFEEILQKKRRR
jgi:hypothetical protein